MKTLSFLMVFSLLLSPSFANEVKQAQGEGLINLDSIKDILKNDSLEQEVKKKQQAQKKARRRKVLALKQKYDTPKDEDFWAILSEYWLVKNAPLLKWDFRKPDYGVAPYLESFLRNIGLIEKKFRILYINSPTISHFAFPYKKNEFLFIISVPFIRSLDLSKLEISIMILEDYFRLEQNFFQDYVMTKEIRKALGVNFFKKKYDMAFMDQALKRIDEFVLAKGFSFKQQHVVTMKMEAFLKNNLKLWNSYLGLLRKVDTLVTTNLLYRQYLNIYPSPEVQLNWLTPKK